MGAELGDGDGGDDGRELGAIVGLSVSTTTVSTLTTD